MSNYLNRHILHRLKLGFAILLTLLFTGSCSSDTKNQITSPAQIQTSAKVNLSLTGKELFAKNCKLCHGINGQLQLNGAKDLRESVLSLAERQVLISEGKNAMTPFKRVLTEEEIRKVAEYSLSFKKAE